MASAPCFSGRSPAFTATGIRTGSRGRTQPRQPRGVSVRSSLEEEFKRQLLGLSNGTSSSSSSQERLKDLSASATGRLSGDHSSSAAAAASSSSSAGSSSSNQAAPAQHPGVPPPASQQQQQGAVQPPAPDSDQQQQHAEPAPFTASLPLSGEPYHPLEFYPTSQIELDWGAGTGDEPWAGPGATERSRCFVILFGVGRAETEGIYSLRAVAKDDGLPVDTIVAFEAEDDALRYSTLLEATMDHEPTVWPIEWGELLEFCNSAGYRCRLEPAGSLLIPPDYNVGMTDWEKSLKLRKGEFFVLGAEPAPAGAPSGQPRSPADGFFREGANWVFEPAPAPQDAEELELAQASALIDSQLSSLAGMEAARAHLERLLPQE